MRKFREGALSGSVDFTLLQGSIAVHGNCRTVEIYVVVILVPKTHCLRR